MVVPAMAFGVVVVGVAVVLFCCYGSVVFLAGGWGGGSRSFTAAAGMEAERKSFGPSPG